PRRLHPPRSRGALAGGRGRAPRDHPRQPRGPGPPRPRPHAQGAARPRRDPEGGGDVSAPSQDPLESLTLAARASIAEAIAAERRALQPDFAAILEEARRRGQTIAVGPADAL